MKNVKFKPWVGKNYQNGNEFGKKILVIGESHYCEDCEDVNESDCSDFTQKLIQTLVDGKTASWTGTFRKFERSLVGHETTPEESARIWNSLAFYNYLQTAVPGPRKSGTPEDYDKSEDAFYEVLNTLQPDAIIVWGVTRMWDNMPSRGWKKGDEIEVDGHPLKQGSYTLDNGHEIKAIWINHPSSGYSWERWNKAIKEVL